MPKKLAGILLGSILAALLGYEVLCFLARPVPEHAFFNPDRFLVIAHRGGRGLGPEGTLYTFQRAVRMGADVLEMDLRRTRDGTLVLLHDPTVERTTNGTGEVRNFALAALQKLDAGYRWTPDNGRTFPLRGKSLTIPTLAEVFAAFPKTRMNIEIKDAQPSTVKSFCRMIQAHDKTEQVLVASFDAGPLKQFRAECPDVATSAAGAEAFFFNGLQKVRLEAVYAPEAEALQVPAHYGNQPVVTPRLVAAAHARNLRIHVWTVNDAARMRHFLELGVDGIITDYPDRLLNLLHRGERRPPPA
ncbi:MAG: glycerophosphodiester phosphodiesterase [Desulfobacterales bacterium]|nr:MAG: glycerophosphodiester phosphodiesterase [Desulfobacterales bacterium]